MGKENVPQTREDDQILGDKPELSLPIVEEQDQDEEDEDEDDSALEAAPTPSILPGGEFEYDPTVTFKSIDFAAKRPASDKIDRRRSSILPSNPGVDEDEDVTAEIGRRAVSEAPMDRFGRNSFGSIRMSGFGVREQTEMQDTPLKKTPRRDTLGTDPSILIENDVSLGVP